MPTAASPVRGQGTLVAIGFPIAAALVVALRLDLHRVGIDTGIPAAVVLVALTALAERINIVVARRTSVSTAGAFLVAAALVGGPLLGACAGASLEAFTTRDGWRKRSANAGAGALQGFAVGIVGEQLTRHVRRRRVRGRRVGDWVRAVRGVDRGRRARPRRQAAPRAPGLLAGDRARLAPTGAAPRRVPLPLPDGAGSRAGVRRRPAARGRGREPVPPTPGTETCGGTLARAG